MTGWGERLRPLSIPPMRWTPIVWLVSMAWVPQVTAQSVLPPWEWTAFVGIARDSPVGTRWGSTPDRDHYFVGLHGSVVVARAGPLALAYAPELLPVFVVTNNPRVSTLPDGSELTTGRGMVYGAGVAPMGLEGRLQVSSRVVALLTGTVGGLWFTRRVPEPTTGAFNFTFDYGAALQAVVRNRLTVRVGYRFHHLSNLYGAPENPGLDGHIFYLGFGRAVR